jgi:hypothetical protein
MTEEVGMTLTYEALEVIEQNARQYRLAYASDTLALIDEVRRLRTLVSELMSTCHPIGPRPDTQVIPDTREESPASTREG